MRSVERRGCVWQKGELTNGLAVRGYASSGATLPRILFFGWADDTQPRPCVVQDE
jgi:hypothetical protein